MYESLISYLLIVLVVSCNSIRDPKAKGGTASKGNAAFQSMMSQGTGTLRPPSVVPQTSLNLSGTSIQAVKTDEASGAWAWVGFDTSLGEIIPADQDLMNYASQWIGRYESELGFNRSEILARDGAVQVLDPSNRLVTLRRQYQGIPVQEAFINLFFVVRNDGTLRLSEVVNNSFGEITMPGEAPSLPSDRDALESTGVDELDVMGRTAVIRPVLKKNGSYGFIHASVFQLKDRATNEDITLTLENSTHEIREAFSNHLYEAQTISLETYARSYIEKTLASIPLSFTSVRDGATQVTTDAKGQVDTENKAVGIALTNTSQKKSVRSGNAAAAVVSFPVALNASGAFTVKLEHADAAALNAYAAMQKATAFVSQYLTAQEAPPLTKGFDAIVNYDTADDCNAFYDGSTLVFFKKSNRCANTGLINDIVIHEWGHGLDDYMGPNSRANGRATGITDAAYSEGIGDILSAYLNRAPNLAPGFFVSSMAPLRNLVNTRQYPPSGAQAEVHEAGMIVAGSFWDMHENLSRLYGQEQGNALASRLFLKHLLTSDRYVDAYQAVLRADDNDGNTATRSPNYCNITKAFANHRLTAGTTAGADCLDQDTSLHIKIDLDRGAGQLQILASAAGAEKIIACPGKVIACKAADKGFVVFEKSAGDGIYTDKSDRRFYTARGVLNVSQSQSYTFFSMDSKEVPVGTKTIEFVADETSPTSVDPAP